MDLVLDDDDDDEEEIAEGAKPSSSEEEPQQPQAQPESNNNGAVPEPSTAAVSDVVTLDETEGASFETQPAVAIEQQQLINKRVIDLKKLADDKDLVAAFPEAMVDYYLRQAGCELADERLNKLVSLELQSFVQDILEDVKKITTLKATSGKPKKKQKVAVEKQEGSEDAFVLQSNDVETVLRGRKIPAAQAPFHPASTDGAI
jgi:hypothetical protein